MDQDSPNEPGANLPPIGDGDNSIPDTDEPGTDGGKKPKPDAGPADAGPPPPDPGTACSVDSEVRQKACGACGFAKTVCLDTGSGLQWTDYGACEGEIVGGCEPGTVEQEACGNCGTRTKTCTQYCAWTITACGGEPTNGCSAGTVAWSSAGCSTAGTFRKRACSDTCGWGTFSTCSSPDFRIEVPNAAGQTANLIVPISPLYTSKRVTGICTSENGATVGTDDHNAAFVRVTNPTNKTATVTAYSGKTATGPILDTTLVSYNSVTIPRTDAALKACDKGASTSCSTGTLPCGDSKFGALTGGNALVIPPGQSRLVSITLDSKQGTAGQVQEGEILFAVRADKLE